MKWTVFLLLLINVARAGESLVIPAFLEAAEIYQEGTHLSVVRPELRAVIDIFDRSGVSTRFLSRYLIKSRVLSWPLPEDRYDQWLLGENKTEGPAIALHALKLEVIEESDDFFNDDLYAYFFITDGIIPTGKVTSTYKGLDEGEAFFFNETDRVLFPVGASAPRRPTNHLIIDYGIVESDGDDIGELQKMTGIITDIAAAVYAHRPEGALLINLRKEVKALANLLLGLNHDDRLVTGTLAYRNEDLARELANRTFLEQRKKHKQRSRWDSWEYDLYFRVLRAQ